MRLRKAAEATRIATQGRLVRISSSSAAGPVYAEEAKLTQAGPIFKGAARSAVKTEYLLRKANLGEGAVTDSTGGNGRKRRAAQRATV